MDRECTPGERSRVTLFGHPIHPMLVPFPIGFLVGGFVADLLFWWTGSSLWAEMALALVVAGLLTGIVAASVGLIDFITLQRPRAHLAGWIHFGGNALVLLLALTRSVLSWSDPVATVLPWGIVLSAVISALLVVTGWMGGELAYRYKVGVIEVPIRSGAVSRERKG